MPEITHIAMEAHQFIPDSTLLFTESSHIYA